jgi:ABC-2 type transport system ATP-binding protein
MSNLLEIRNLKKNYGNKEIVKGIDFKVKDGEILGFIGPNGAGKSTTVKMIMDIERKDGGEILYLNKNTRDNKAEFKKALGVVPQEIAVYDDLNAYDNVKFFAALYQLSGKELNLRTEEALEFTGLTDYRTMKPGTFSGGMKRRLNIACSIAHRPKLLIMDEPTVGIDPQSRNHILESIKKLNAMGTTVIYISHYMEEIEEICSRIILMDHGTILEDLAKEELKRKYEKLGFLSLEEIFLHLTGTDLRDREA